MQASPSPSSASRINQDMNSRKFLSSSNFSLHQSPQSIKTKTEPSLAESRAKEESTFSSKLLGISNSLNKGMNNIQVRSRPNLYDSVDLKVSRAAPGKHITIQPETGSASSQKKEAPVSLKDLKFSRSPSTYSILSPSQLDSTSIIDKLNRTKKKLGESEVNPILKRLTSTTSKQPEPQKEELAEFKPTFHS